MPGHLAHRLSSKSFLLSRIANEMFFSSQPLGAAHSQRHPPLLAAPASSALSTEMPLPVPALGNKPTSQLVTSSPAPIGGAGRSLLGQKRRLQNGDSEQNHRISQVGRSAVFRNTWCSLSLCMRALGIAAGLNNAVFSLFPNTTNSTNLIPSSFTLLLISQSQDKINEPHSSAGGLCLFQNTSSHKNIHKNTFSKQRTKAEKTKFRSN